jgi:GNAT superfamily N-acetyltransferase
MKPFLRPVLEADFDFAFEAKKDAMGPYIRVRWGWDHDYQLSIHKLRWAEKPWFVVMVEDAAIGTVSIHEQPEFVRFGEFYVLSAFRGRGFGSMILEDFCLQCDESSRAARLEYLKWNPVGSLYKRHGFEVISEDDIHYFMERKARARPPRR